MRELKKVRRGYVPEFIPRLYFLQLFYANVCCDLKWVFYVHSVCKLRSFMFRQIKTFRQFPRVETSLRSWKNFTPFDRFRRDESNGIRHKFLQMIEKGNNFDLKNCIRPGSFQALAAFSASSQRVKCTPLSAGTHSLL